MPMSKESETTMAANTQEENFSIYVLSSVSSMKLPYHTHQNTMALPKDTIEHSKKEHSPFNMMPDCPADSGYQPSTQPTSSKTEYSTHAWVHHLTKPSGEQNPGLTGSEYMARNAGHSYQKQHEPKINSDHLKECL